MKKRRQMVMVAPGKDVTLYIPTDTPPEVIRHLNRLKAEGIFSQGIMEILTDHILGQHVSEGLSPSEEASVPWDDVHNGFEAAAIEEAPEPPVMPGLVKDEPKPFSPQDIIRQATRNAGKLLHDRQ